MLFVLHVDVGKSVQTFIESKRSWNSCYIRFEIVHIHLEIRFVRKERQTFPNDRCQRYRVKNKEFPISRNS